MDKPIKATISEYRDIFSYTVVDTPDGEALADELDKFSSIKTTRLVRVTDKNGEIRLVKQRSKV